MEQTNPQNVQITPEQVRQAAAVVAKVLSNPQLTIAQGDAGSIQLITQLLAAIAQGQAVINSAPPVAEAPKPEESKEVNETAGDNSKPEPVTDDEKDPEIPGAEEPLDVAAESAHG